jgi:hypothetical protein
MNFEEKNVVYDLVSVVIHDGKHEDGVYRT